MHRSKMPGMFVLPAEQGSNAQLGARWPRGQRQELLLGTPARAGSGRQPAEEPFHFSVQTN